MKIRIQLLFIYLFVCTRSFSQSWSMLPTSGPITARTNASAIYISSGNRMVVFGGHVASVGSVNEIWNLDLNTNAWSLITPKSTQTPSPRSTHICMYDSVWNRMIVWSGQGSQLYNDVWAFNFNDSTWLELWADGNVSGAPLKRYGAATVFDPVNRNLINFAGFTTSGRFDDTWEFDVDNLNWVDRTNSYFPLKRCLTSQSFAPDRREMIVFAGQENGNLNDIWTLNTDTYVWTNRTPSVNPIARHFTSNVYCGNGNIVIFGGNSLNQGNTAGVVNDLWKFSLNTQQWDTLPQGIIKPSARLGHTSIYIPSQDKLIIFGGQGISLINNETWVYSGISSFVNTVDEHSEKVTSLKVYPNPSSDLRNLSFQLQERSEVTFTITNVLGERIVISPPEEMNEGSHSIELSGYKLSQGIYVCTLKTTTWQESIQFVVID